MKDNIIEVMASVPYVKKLAREAGLFASYIPVVGSIQILDRENRHVAISHDGRMVKINKKRESLQKWLRAMALSRNLTLLMK